jgi:hypothetical protein
MGGGGVGMTNRQRIKEMRVMRKEREKQNEKLKGWDSA